MGCCKISVTDFILQQLILFQKLENLFIDNVFLSEYNINTFI